MKVAEICSGQDDKSTGTGIEKNGKFDPILSLTGKPNLLIFIQDGSGGVIDKNKMKTTKGNWDYIVVKDFAQAAEVLESKYGKTRSSFIQNLVVKAHGWCGFSEVCSGGMLTNDANILFTSCSIVNCYWVDKNSEGFKKLTKTEQQKQLQYKEIARKTAVAFSKYLALKYGLENL